MNASPAADRGCGSALSGVYLAAGATAAARQARQRAVDAFAGEYGDLSGWARAPLAERLAAPVAVRGFAAWAVLHTHRPVDADYVMSSASAWGHHATVIDPDFGRTFHSAARKLGFATQEIDRQWAIAAKLAASPAARHANSAGSASTPPGTGSRT